MSLNTIVPARSMNAVRKPKIACVGFGRVPRPIVSATRTANPIMRQFGILTSVKNGASRAEDAGLADSNAARPRDLWFPQLQCFRISLNKLTRYMPISTYVRQERVHLTGRPKPGPGGGNPGSLPVPLPEQDR